MPRGNVLAVVGAQAGSEGKGNFVHAIADRYDIHVRTGGCNAGHTFYHRGVKHVMQTIPCGWTNKNAMLIIGRGALISLDILANEVEAIRQVDPTIVDRLRIDEKAGVIASHHHTEEGGVNGEMHKRIGSTGEGVGAARRDRLMRDPERFYNVYDAIYKHGKQVGNSHWDLADFLVDNTHEYLYRSVSAGMSVLLEGTQGSTLDLIHGPWPTVTSNGCGAAQLAADAGIPPSFVNQVMLVARTFPIRVAGNSGPLAREITWEQLSQELGREVSEQTTVTKKTRRVGRWDEALIDSAVYLNGPTSFAISFLDYLCKDDADVTSIEQLSDTSKAFIKYVQLRFKAPVSLVSTGPKTVIETGAKL